MGERRTLGPAPVREQTETMSRGTCTTRLRPGAPGAHGGAGGIRNTKDRDTPALEVRAGTPAVGRTSRDAAGLSSTNRNGVKVAITSEENGPRSLCSKTEAEIRPLLL